MFINSSNVLFMSMTIMGVMVSFSSMSLFMMWIGMEISLMSFIPIITMKSVLNSEFSIKYFIIQSLSSMIIMLSMMMMMMKEYNFNSFLTCSLMMKMGSAPFHNWVVSTIDGLLYEPIFFLLTLMKLSPLLMLSYLNMNLIIFIISSMIIGSINGLNQSSMKKLKKLLVFSSIYNLGLILYSLSINTIWIQMMVIYSLILLSILIIMKKFKITFLNQFMLIENNNFKKMMILFCLISLGGMPPFLGFQMKMMIFELMLINKNFILILIMILSSMIILYYYVNMIISLLLFYSLTIKMITWFKMKIKLNFLLLMINLNLFFPLMMMKFLT
uniref:NADH-ubiquinone oxidoreductase chain 2 n=1 Tax=Krisna concava TaxID=1962554 RepID=A0A6C0MCW8_9HEMI|nr:NADH dehydrogenase subunit 2 [Krisna concava]QHV34346.1 NADH dehydrogenase subunit 2 [Krisna concava]